MQNCKDGKQIGGGEELGKGFTFTKRNEEIFEGDENVHHLDCGGGYRIGYVCQNSWKYMLKRMTFNYYKTKNKAKIIKIFTVVL